MGDYITNDYKGALFQFLGVPQIVTLILIILLNIFLLRDRNKDGKVRFRTRWTIAIILGVNELLFHVRHIYYGSWNIQGQIPLHACSILIWLSGFMLIKKNKYVYEFSSNFESVYL